MWPFSKRECPDNGVAAVSRKDPSSIGNVLIGLGYCTQTDIDSAMGDDLIGETLVRHGTITRESLEVAVLKQQQMRGKVDHPKVISALDRLADRRLRIVEATDNLHGIALAAVKEA